MDLLELLNEFSRRFCIPITVEVEETQMQVVQGNDFRIEFEEGKVESLRYKDKVCNFSVIENPQIPALIVYSCKEKYLDGVREILRRTNTRAGDILLDELKDVKFDPNNKHVVRPDGRLAEIYPYANQTVRRTNALTPEEVYRFIHTHITEY